MPSSQVLKITIRKTDDQSCHSTTIDFNQSVPLKIIISDLCKVWSVTESPENFSLLFNDSDVFVSEKNRCDIKNGSILRLSSSASKTSQFLLKQLKASNKADRVNALSQLVRFSSDATFSAEFNLHGGRAHLLDSLVDASLEPSDDEVTYTLEALNELVNQDAWDSCCTPQNVKAILSIINETKHRPNKLLLVTLSILESIINCSSEMAKLIGSEINFPNVVSLLRSNQSEIQQNCLAMINALLTKSELNRRVEMYTKLTQNDFRKVILDCISGTSASIGTEMAHQLHVLQSLILSLYTNEPRETESGINQLRKFAFQIESSRGLQDDLVRLGFMNTRSPADEVSSCPLAIDLMIYYVRNKRDDFNKHVVERKLDREHECPFARSSIQLTKLLYQLLRIGEAATDEGQCYWPIILTTDHPLEELFCESINLFYKTWREMRATSEDFSKVFSVLSQQLNRAFKDTDAIKSFDKLHSTLNRLAYPEMLSIWAQERLTREQWEKQAESIAQLRNILRPSIVDLIKQQRLLLLTKGTRFSRYSNKGHRIKDKYWFCRLTANHKAFIYGDCEESKIPTIDELPHKLNVSEITSLTEGRDCPHVKEWSKAKKATSPLAFTLVTSCEPSGLDFVAPDQRTYDHWLDGVRALLDTAMKSSEFENDMETLLTMEIKIRLLDTEGVSIPEKQPQVPPPPSNYIFHFS